VSGRPSVVVVGGMNIDIQGKSYLPYRAKDSNPGSFDLVPGGVGRNIAENLVRLGVRVELVSALGDDDFSHSLEDSCASIGIGLSGSLRLKRSPASLYLCLLDSDGSLVGAVCSMDSIDALLPERLAERAPLLDSADLILVDANVPEASIAWLAARYPQGGGRPILGFDPAAPYPSVPLARQGTETVCPPRVDYLFRWCRALRFAPCPLASPLPMDRSFRDFAMPRFGVKAPAHLRARNAVLPLVDARQEPIEVKGIV